MSAATVTAGLRRLGALLDADERARGFARTSAVGLAIRVASTGLFFGVQLVVLRLFGSEAYGRYAFGSAWLLVLSVPAKLGYDVAAVRFAATYADAQNPSLLRALVGHVRRRVGLASWLVAVPFATAAAVWYGPRDPATAAALIVVAVMLPPYALLRVGEGLLRAQERVLAALLPYHVAVPAAVALALLPLSLVAGPAAGAVAVLGVQLAAILAAAGFMGGAVSALPPASTQAGEDAPTRQWDRAGRRLMLSSGFGLLLSQLDVILIGLLVDTTAAGIYAVAARTAGLLGIFLFASNFALAPVAARLHARGEIARLQTVVRGTVLVVAGVSTVTAFGLAVLFPSLAALFGSEFEAARGPLLVLLVGQLVNVLAGPVALLLNMTGHERDTARLLGMSAAASLLGGCVLIPLAGPLGAALVTACSLSGFNVAAAVLVRRRLGIRVLGVGRLSDRPRHS